MTNKLSSYLEQHGIDDTAFGLLIGKDRTTVNRWKKGRGTPTLADAAKVQTVTDGAVPMSSWVNEAESPA